MPDKTLFERNEELAARMAEKMGVGGRDLPAKLRRAGRMLPPRLRREGRYLVEAAALDGHPRLAMQIDRGRVETAYAALEKHLDGVDLADLRWGRFLGILATLAFNLLIFAALVIALLVWRGDIGTL